MEEVYKSKRFVDRIRWVVVDKTGKVINNDPSEDELKYLKKEPRKAQDTRKYKKYTDEELLDYLIKFYEVYGEVPRLVDFVNNPECPGASTYTRRFGSFQKALKLVKLDVDSVVIQGIITTCRQKARLAEIKVLEHFKKLNIDFAGENCNSPCDGMCPNGKMYDVKSSELHDGTRYKFGTDNKYKEEIEIYYFLAFSKDYTKLDYGWRVPGEMVESSMFHVGLSNSYKFNIGNMEEYDITDKLRDVLGRNVF